MISRLCPRPVNSGVRFLLNALAQNIKSAILNFDEGEGFLNDDAAWML